MSARAANGRSQARVAVVALLALCVVVAMMLTSGAMANLRESLPWLSNAMNWLEFLPIPFDMDHVVFFTGIAGAARLLLPHARWWWFMLAVALLAAGTEMVQFWVPGRTPHLLDARDDLIGGAIGFVLGSMPAWLARFTSQQLAISRALVLGGVVLLPLQQWWPMRVFGFPGLVCDPLFAAAIGVRAFAWMGGRAPLRINGSHGWLLVYLFAMGLACFAAWPAPDSGALMRNHYPIQQPDPWTSVGKWIGIAYLAAIAVVVADFARDAWYTRELALAWIVAAAVTSVMSVIAISAFYTVPTDTWLQPLLSHYGSLPPGNYPRIKSLFANANMLCNFLVVAVALLLVARQSSWLSLGHFRALLALMLVSAIATISPGLGGLVLVLATWRWFVMRARAPRRAMALLVAGCVIALLIFAGMWLNLADPFASESVRVQIWQQAIQTLLDHPLRGVGLAKPVVGVAFTDPSGGEQWLTDAHNVWLNVGGQAGLLGMAALAGLSVWLLWNARREVAVTGGCATSAFGLALAFVAAFLYGGLTGSFEDARHVWVLIGLLAAIGSTCHGNSRHTTAENANAPSGSAHD